MISSQRLSLDFGIVEGEAGVVFLAASFAAAVFEQIVHIFDPAAALLVDVHITWTRSFRLDNERGAPTADKLKFLFVDFVIVIHNSIHARFLHH